MQLTPIREKPNLAPYKAGDVLVLFGELFNRGYANGLVEEAERRGLKVIFATVGRRDKEGSLRPLNEEELFIAKKPLINIPLEAGFDLEPSKNGVSPVDQLKDIKLSDWEGARLDFSAIKESQTSGRQRFREKVMLYMQELEQHIPEGAHVIFAHLMAGGVPRAKIVMPLMNRAFKGTGERYLSSEKFWNSDIGKLCQMNFLEVTAETFHHLIELSAPLRQKLQSKGGNVSYLAYGYHGTEILMDDKYTWQTYTPYLQGWAKMRLEEIAKEFMTKGVSACVYNCPEILTQSSSIFQGVEVSLYPLLGALEKEASQHKATAKIFNDCQSLLKEGLSFDDVVNVAVEFFQKPEIKAHCLFEKWPQHSSAAQLKLLLDTSDQLISLHKDEKVLITNILSEVVFRSCGYIMLNDGYKPKQAAAWIGHDAVAKCVDSTW